MCNSQVYPDIEEYLRSKLEGRVFEHIYMLTMLGGTEHSIHIDYYTVQQGKVYIIEGDGTELSQTRDTLFNLQKDCHCLGKYNPAKKYKPVRQSYPSTLFKKKLGFSREGRHNG